MRDTARPRADVRRVIAEMGPERRLLWVNLVLLVLMMAFNISVPVLVGVAIDRGVIGRDPRALGAALSAAAGSSAAFVVLAWVQIRVVGRFGQEWLSGLRSRLLRQLHTLDMDRITGEVSGRVVARLTSDVDNLQQFTDNALSMGIAAAFSAVLTLLAMLLQSTLLTAAVAALLLPIAVVAVRFRERVHAAQLEVRDRTAQLLGRIGEAISGMRLVQAYNAETHQRSGFEGANDATMRARMRTVRLLMAYSPPIEFLQPVALAVVFVLGLWMVGRGALQVGVLVSFVLLVQRLFEPIQQFAELSMVSQSAAASLTRISGFLDERPAVRDAPDARAMPPGDGRVEVRGVSFSYAPHLPAVLRDVDLVVPAGQRLAVIGESGAGKSTLARLLVRFDDPTAGAVLVDGVDLRTVTLTSLRRTVALVPQEGFLFDGTVASNLAMVRDGATRAAVEAAMASGGMLDALSALPHGLDTRLRGGGRNLSAGQRQLVALARALFADPRVVVLDEATSNLDPATEAAVEGAMRAVLEGRTAVVIAHRVATALRADRVVLMQDGRVVEDGRPAEMRLAGTRFARWVAREERAS